MWAMIRQAVVCVLAGAVAACTHIMPPPTSPASAPPAPDEAWARVLQRAVDRQGRLDFTLVAHDRTDLDSYLAYVAQVSPHTHATLFPSRPDALAYYLNSYNALALYGVILKRPSDFDSFPARVKFFKLTTYRVGGQSVSLYDYENAIIRPLGEPRVHFALNCMVIGCPRLPQLPFRAQILEQQLEAAAQEFCNSVQHVQVQPERRTVRLSEIFRFYTADFVNERVAPSLIAYINRYRTQKIPEDFAIEFIPYNWLLNTQ
jgi:Protein of unknown function, DUF547